MYREYNGSLILLSEYNFFLSYAFFFSSPIFLWLYSLFSFFFLLISRRHCRRHFDVITEYKKEQNGKEGICISLCLTFFACNNKMNELRRQLFLILPVLFLSTVNNRFDEHTRISQTQTHHHMEQVQSIIISFLFYNAHIHLNSVIFLSCSFNVYT